MDVEGGIAVTLSCPYLCRRVHSASRVCAVVCCGALLAIALTACAEQPPGPAAVPVPGYPTFGSASAVAGAWQQFCEQVSNVPQANALVAARGMEGWELVAMYNGVLCYKRPSFRPFTAPAAAPSYAPETQAAHPYVSPYYHRDVRDPGF
jgi:hypothetical protein